MKRTLSAVSTVIILITFVLPASAQTFTEVTSLLGDTSIDVPRNVEGASAVDVNNDGLVDLYRYRKLYIQLADGSFSDRLTSSGISDVRGSVQGAVWADYDNDGFVDLLLPNTTQTSELYHNQRVGFFRRANGAAGVSIPTAGIGAIFSDFDADGVLDLFVARTDGNNLYFQGQDNGVFRDRTFIAGVSGIRPPCGVSTSDVNHDGKADIYTSSCDTTPGMRQDHLLLSTGPGRFSDGRSSFTPDINGSISRAAVWADFNRDGWEDLYVGNEVEEPPPEAAKAYNTLYLNESGSLRRVINIGEGTGGALDQTWALAAADFDNDGWVDILVSNRTGQDVGPPVNRLLRNNGDGTFTDVLPSALDADFGPTALAVADVNGDGWIDIFAPSLQGDRLFYNIPGANHWLDVTLAGVESNIDGIGARVVVTSGSGLQEAQIRTADGYASQNMNLSVHFGLGSESVVDEVAVFWPNGNVDRISNVTADRRIRIVEGLGLNDSPPSPVLSTPADGTRIDLSDGPISFSWDPVRDPDDDGVLYNLYISGPGVDSVFTDLSVTSITLTPDFLTQRQSFLWTVTSSDGYGLHSSRQVFSFRFGGSNVAEPVRMNYSLSGIYSGSVSFADYDGDSDPDLLVIGTAGKTPVAKVYQSVDTLFTEGEFDVSFPIYRDTQAILKKVEDAIGEWVDYDSDGDPDILLAGRFLSDGQESLVTEMYENIQTVFTQDFSFQLPGVHSGAADWGDYDGDGDLDLVLTGATSIDPPYRPMAAIYRNDGGRFTDINANLTPAVFSDADWGDIDGDGDLDLVIMGQSSPGHFETNAYINDGAGGFTASSLVFPGLAFGSVAFGDMDADGDEDLLLTGGSTAPELIRGEVHVFRNDGASLVDIGAQQDIVGTAFGKADWLDYDGDGDLDILVTGAPNPLGERSAWVYRNEESIRFAEEFKLSGLLFSDIAVTDFRSDGDADFVVAGLDENGAPSVFFFANMLHPEQIPSALTPR